MKPSVYVVFFLGLLVTSGVCAQTVVVSDNVNDTTGHISSVLDVKSTSKGMLVPRMTQAQRTAIATPAEGLLVYQTDGSRGFYYYTGAVWTLIASGSGSQWVTNGSNIYYNTGKVGIGNTAPGEALDVTGNLKFNGALMPNNNPGTSGNVLVSNGVGTAPSWTNSDTSLIPNFYLKVRSLFSATAPITYNNGLIGITQAGVSSNGYLSSTDWNAFNNKISGNQVVTLSGDISGSGTTAITTTIGAGRVSNTMLAQVPTQTFKGRASSGTGAVEDLTTSQAKALLDLTGINTGDQTITLNGDVTGTGTGSFAATIAARAVSYSKIQNVSASNKVLGRVTSGAGSIEEISTTGSGNVVMSNSPTITTPVGIVKSDIGLGNVDNTSDANKPVSTAVQTALNLKINSSEKAANNGVATLDATGKIPATQLPTGALVYKGTWDASSNTPALSDAAGQNGWLYKVSVAGTQNLGSGSVNYDIGDEVIHNGTVYQLAPASVSDVISVNSQTGAVVLNTSNVSEVTNLYYTDARARAAISAVSPLSYSSASGMLTLPQSSASASGYLSAADWTTFNSKQSSGSYITALSGDIAATGPGNVTATINPNAVTYSKIQNISATNKVLGRVSTGAGTVEEISTTGTGDVLRSNSPTITTPVGLVKGDVGLGNVDNTSDVNKPVSTAVQTALNLKINSSDKGANNGVASLDAGGKIPTSQLPTGALIYKGVWNASTNTPTISDASGQNGWMYNVNVAGTQNLGSGSLTFAVGDQVIHNGTVWQLAPNGTAVTSVNGQTGAVVLNTANISESSNLYYTDTRVRSALSATAPLTFNSTSGNFSMNQATTSANGYLTSTDWNIFNNKQSAGSYLTGLTGDISATGPGTANAVIAANAVTTAKILDANVTTAKIADLNVTTAKIQDANVTALKIADLNVTTAKINDLAVTTAKIADNGVTNAKLAQMPASTFKGNNTGATANAVDLTATQATAMLNTFTSSAQGLVPASGGGTSTFLRADGTFAAPTGAVYRNLVTLSADVVNNNSTANTLADVTGLSFAVTAGVTYRFEAMIAYTSAATNTGSRWTINGPASPTLLNYTSTYTITATSQTVNYATAYSIPAASNASSLAAGSIAIIKGIIKPSASGTVVIRFASEVANSAITAKAGSTLEWW